MTQPMIAAREPKPVDLKAGRDYWWCSCGLSQRQPFCDGSHKVTTFTPLQFTPVAEEQKWLCQCKQTKTPPYCDGSHKAL